MYVGFGWVSFQKSKVLSQVVKLYECKFGCLCILENGWLDLELTLKRLKYHLLSLFGLLFYVPVNSNGHVNLVS